jgi:hypothetical protein
MFSRENGQRSSAAVSSILITKCEMNVDPPAHDLDSERNGKPQWDGKGNGHDQEQIIETQHSSHLSHQIHHCRLPSLQLAISKENTKRSSSVGNF